jgi:hypothetical protein
MMARTLILTFAALALAACGDTDAQVAAENAAFLNAQNAAAAAKVGDGTGPRSGRSGTAASVWSYRTERDEMRDAETKFATLESTNNVPVTWPYTPGPASVMLRRKPSEGLEVIILIEGQFTCSLSGDTVAVKFDDGPIQTYGCSEAVGGTGALFLRSPARFLTNLKAAKKVIIELPVYEAGKVQMTWAYATPPEFP